MIAVVLNSLRYAAIKLPLCDMPARVTTVKGEDRNVVVKKRRLDPEDPD